MGQAKRRGTFEERLAAAVERNQKLEMEVLPNAGPRMKDYHAKHGTQATATRMIMAGLRFIPMPR